MTAAATSLLESVLALPKRDRLKIAEALLDSMPKETGELDDETLFQELKSRADEARADPSAGIAWSEVKKNAVRQHTLTSSFSNFRSGAFRERGNGNHKLAVRLPVV